MLGKQALGLAYLGANSMLSGHYISEHDAKISQKLAYVLCGGDLSAPTLVSEQYLLDLEREAFLSLCGEKKTLERLQSILTGGKILMQPCEKNLLIYIHKFNMNFNLQHHLIQSNKIQYPFGTWLRGLII